MKLTVTITCLEEAFDQCRAPFESAKLLRQVATQIEQGATSGILRSNRTVLGYWTAVRTHRELKL